MGGAHLVDDVVNLILDLAGRLHLTLLEVLIHLQEELGHNGIGTSDAGAGAHGQTGDELLIGPVKNEQILVMPHLDILGWHGGVLHADHTGVFLHLPQQRGGQGHPRQLGDVVDDKVGVGGGGGDIIPVLGDAVLGQVEVDGRNGGNGVHPQALRVGGQGLAVRGGIKVPMTWLSAVLLHATWAMTTTLPLASAITFSSTTLRSSTP